MLKVDNLAFGPEQAAKLSRLTVRQLVYWRNTGFFSPSGGDPERRPPSAWLYTFRDVVGLRAIGELRRHVALQSLRKVAIYLKESHSEPWTNLVFYVIDSQVYHQGDQDAIRRADASGQTALPFDIPRIVGDVRKDVERLRQRGRDQIGTITSIHSRHVLNGTRIPTQAVWEFHKANYSVSDIRQQYPQLTDEDVNAAIIFENARLKKTG